MDKGPTGWLAPFLEPLRPAIRETLTSTLFINVLALAVPIFVMQVYDRVVAQSGLETLKALFIGIVLVLVFDTILRRSRARVLQTVALRLDVAIGERLFTKLMRLPLRRLESKPAAHWQQLFRDLDLVRNTLSGATAVLLADLPFVVIFLGMVFVIGPPLALVFVIVLAVFLVLAWHSGRALAGTSEREKAVLAGRDALVAEIIAGRGPVKALALDRALRPLWEERQAGAIEHAVRRGATADGYATLGSELTMLATVLMTTVGALSIIDHELTMGALIACNMLSSRLFGPINQLVGGWRTYGAFRQSAQRLGAMLAEPEDRGESALSMPRPAGRMTVERALFRYDPKAPPTIAIELLDIRPGGVVAVLGRNGSGKTTLLKLLMGLYAPDEGRVLLDGADIGQFSRAELASWIGYVPQETVLFAGTVRDNIAFGAPDADDDRLREAAEAAGVHAAIVDMPDGYATEIGEAGARLSAGQRQRIAIARALAGDPAVLLLDEPTASLDRQAEEDLKATLARLARDRTVIVVTHSPALLSACRDVVVLDKGRLAAAGPAAEVLPRLFGPRSPQPPAAARPEPVVVP